MLLGLASNARPWTSFLIIPFPLEILFDRHLPGTSSWCLLRPQKSELPAITFLYPFGGVVGRTPSAQCTRAPPPPSSQVPQVEIAPRYKKRPRPSISRAPDCLLSCCCCGAMHSSHPLGRFEQYSSVLVGENALACKVNRDNAKRKRGGGKHCNKTPLAFDPDPRVAYRLYRTGQYKTRSLLSGRGSLLFPETR